MRITKASWLGAHEVTAGQFRQFVEASGHNAGDSWKSAFPSQTDDHPVVNVSWDDASAFCTWLSAKEGRTYRLATEAEWEYACRAGTTTRWCFGDDEAQLADYAWWGSNSQGTTHPVGQKKANAWGLYDMHGNAYEWCADCFEEGYYWASPSDDPIGASSVSSRVLRGGSWFDVARFSRCAFRNWLHAVNRRHFVGFRAARTP